MAFTFFTFLAIINLSPRAFGSTQISPQMYCCAKMLITSATEFNSMNLARLETDRCCMYLLPVELIRGPRGALFSQTSEQVLQCEPVIYGNPYIREVAT